MRFLSSAYWWSLGLRPGDAPYELAPDHMHPLMTMTSGVAAFPETDGRRGIPFVLNRTHHASEYVHAFLDARLRITACFEPVVTEEMLPRFPTYQAYPEATREAFLDLPYLLIWSLVRDAS